MKEVYEYFTWIDWTVIAVYMVFTTWLGHHLSGRQSTIKDFFLGGKKLPWWSVTGSMVATEISALTFIGVPGIVFGLQGDWTYLQWGIGSIIARFAVGYYLVPLYYEREIYSPYDFMGDRLGEKVRRLVTALFSLGAILGQSVRVVVTAIILNVVTGLDPALCIALICAFAVLWTFLGGMQTVIWTDVIQFVLFIVGGLIALGWLVTTMGWDQIVQLNQVVVDGQGIDKTNMWNFDFPWESPLVKYTLWIGIIAMPFQNFTAFGVDQLNTQRMFCCGSARDARKAICWSSVSLLITLLMLAVGSGLFAWYLQNPPPEHIAATFDKDSGGSADNVFPTWIVTVLPTGLSGLILAAAFAAAISSLDSILAALSQTSLSIFYGRERMEEEASGAEMVAKSRIAVTIWGVILALVAIGLWQVRENDPKSDLIGLAFGMIAYTYGPLLGILFAAIFRPKVSWAGLAVGTVLSVLIILCIRDESLLILRSVGLSDASEWLEANRPQIVSEWFFAINAALTYGCGLLGGLLQRDEKTLGAR